MPEDKYDPRSLYERLQAEKMKKQEAVDTQRQFSECAGLTTRTAETHASLVAIVAAICPP